MQHEVEAAIGTERCNKRMKMIDLLPRILMCACVRACECEGDDCRHQLRCVCHAFTEESAPIVGHCYLGYSCILALREHEDTKHIYGVQVGLGSTHIRKRRKRDDRGSKQERDVWKDDFMFELFLYLCAHLRHKIRCCDSREAKVFCLL